MGFAPGSTLLAKFSIKTDVIHTQLQTFSIYGIRYMRINDSSNGFHFYEIYVK